jgi:hypothetical protein
MTKEEIIEMAQECGLIGMRPHLDGIYSEALESFAKLVAEHEREACAKLCEKQMEGKSWVGLTDEEQHQLWRQWIESMDGWGSFYRAIEAKLKEKNTRGQK